eukprot:1603199-Pyramimonas_sp.AAC.1
MHRAERGTVHNCSALGAEQRGTVPLLGRGSTTPQRASVRYGAHKASADIPNLRHVDFSRRRPWKSGPFPCDRFFVVNIFAGGPEAGRGPPEAEHSQKLPVLMVFTTRTCLGS